MANEKNCCGPTNVVTVADLCENKKVVKEFVRCVPIRQACDNTTRTVFQSLSTVNPDAIVIFTNTSDCTVTLSVRGTTTQGYTIVNGGSAVTSVTGLNQIAVTCTDGATPTPDMFCTGTLELDLTVGLRF
ncbi:S-Ena type endospore appendage [Paenibacillus endoradicis]|uniref:S-Ena type endospore appendage n=1 Tax=Paenibacillus endoradicis TaxID=2972487 RepID=UPI002158AF01|nr:S-Ena type endospore appendage [Paenibacillus endoradicis]MCR8660120.1 hypothetical protein [Paenibacillus endoradicis]